MMNSLLAETPPVTQVEAAAHRQTVLTPEAVWEPLMALQRYVRKHHYEGHDLFDGLNSRLFKHSPFYRSELLRLAVIQFCKRSPVNLRGLLQVPHGFNSKGGALFLLGHLNLFRHSEDPFHQEEAFRLFERLKETAIPREKGLAWGYNFDWQARAFYVPVGMPNLVTSVYVGRALLALHARFHVPEALDMALGIGRFILNEMIKFENDNHLCFNYIPGKDAEVHNANLLGASYLAQLLPYFDEPGLRDKIMKSVRFSVTDITLDGAWPYGTKPFHRWVDNFHTAYNIECLMMISDALETDDFKPLMEMVTGYYLDNLFTRQGLPKYYNNKLYPIDIHVVSEAIILFNKLRASDLKLDWKRLRLLENTQSKLLKEFQDPAGYFYHQKLSAKKWNKIPYIRWGQAWTFYALSACLANE